MNPAAQALPSDSRSTEFEKPQVRDIYTVDVRKHGDADSIRQALVEQLAKPVRWTATIHAMLASGVRTIVECGPGRVLTGLNRRIEEARKFAAGDRILIARGTLAACRSIA